MEAAALDTMFTSPASWDAPTVDPDTDTPTVTATRLQQIKRCNQSINQSTARTQNGECYCSDIDHRIAILIATYLTKASLLIVTGANDAVEVAEVAGA